MFIEESFFNKINTSDDEDLISDATSEICCYIVSCAESSNQTAQQVLACVEVNSTNLRTIFINFREYFLLYLIDVLDDTLVEKDL
jgi:hypothetical protein